MRPVRLAFCVLAAIVTTALGMSGASAQGYPARPIRVVVPFVAGGAVDTLARLVGNKLSEALGQPVLIENRAGAGGNLGADVVAKAPPDGYTILLTTNGHAISPALYRSLPFDPVKDFIPVTQLVSSSLVLVASPKLPAKSLPELIALAKAKPGSLNYGSTGIGNPLHLTMEMLKSATGIDVVAVPYRGDAPLNTALIAGEVGLAIVPMSTALAHIEAGSIRALAVTSAARSKALPNVPTVAEQGVSGFDSSSWQGFFMPAHTPSEVVALIARETRKVLDMPDVRERLKTFGNEPVGSTPQEFAALFNADLAKFAKIVRDARIPLQD